MSSMFSLLILILSLNLTRCGEVNRPTSYLFFARTRETISAVDPFPLVPVIEIILLGF